MSSDNQVDANQTQYGKLLAKESTPENKSSEEDTTAEGEDYDYKDVSNFNYQVHKPRTLKQKCATRTDSTGFPSNRKLKLNISNERWYKPMDASYKHDSGL